MISKKILSSILILCILVSVGGCAKEQPNTSSAFSMETDSQYWMHRLSFYSATETDRGIYYLDNSSHLLRYIDKTSYLDTPLCPRPECSHVDSEGNALQNCNAFMSGMVPSVFYSKGALYAVTSDFFMEGTSTHRVYFLTQISLDGSQRKKIWEIEFDSDLENPIISKVLLHRGRFYFCVAAEIDHQMVERLYCYSLKTRKRKEVAEFSIHTNGYSNLQELFALGDYLYLSIFSSDEARIYLQYQISTGEWREFPEEYKRAFPFFEGIHFYCSKGVKDAMLGNFWGITTDWSGESKEPWEFPNSVGVEYVSKEYICSIEPGKLYYNEKELTAEEIAHLSEEDLAYVVAEKDPTHDIFHADSHEKIGELPVFEKCTSIFWFSDDRLYCLNTLAQDTSLIGLFYSELNGDSLEWNRAERIQ